MSDTTARPLAVCVIPMETRREVITRLAVRAEALGYSGFFVSEGWGHDATVLLTEIALRTSTIRIGTNVLNVWGRSAATIAMAAASLADASGGRFVLGLGAGSPALAEGLHDVPFHDPIGRLEAVARQVRRLLDGERLHESVAGQSRTLRLAVIPPSRIPITLAALGPRAVTLAGRLADSWSPFFLPLSSLPDAIRQINAAHARENTGEAARPPQIWPGIAVAVSADAAHARSVAAWWVSSYLTSMGPLYPQTLRRAGMATEVEAVIDANPPGSAPSLPEHAQRLIDELTLCGTPEYARRQLDRWYAAGAHTPTLALPPNGDPDELDYILEALAPSRP